MATQPALFGFTPYTVDAISRTAIFLKYAYRTGADAIVENTGSQNVTLFDDSVLGSGRVLLSGDSLPFRTDGPRNTTFPPATPICWARAASGTGSLMVIEK